MEDTSGFYKFENNENLLYAPNGVMHCDYDLFKTNRIRNPNAPPVSRRFIPGLRKDKNFENDNVVLNRISNRFFLVDNWYWFDDENEAKNFFGIVDEPPQSV
jgi:hypothetical protein